MRPTPRSSAGRRTGSIAPLLIFALTTLLACFAFAVNKSWLWSVREDIRLSVDAAGLAAAATLVDDDLIRNDASGIPALLQRASDAARTYAAGNPVRRQPLILLENTDNLTGGDIVFGAVSLPRSGDFLPMPGITVPAPQLSGTNAIVITGRQTRDRGNAPGLIFGIFAGHGAADVAVTSAVTLDRGVRGFRPTLTNTPLAPFALFSDPTGTDTRSFENRVEKGGGLDQQRYDATSHTFVSDPAGDGIAEFAVVYPTDPMQLATANAAIIHLGSSDLNQLADLLVAGYSGDDLADYGRKFVIPEQGGEAFAGQDSGPAGDSPQIQALYQSLEQLRQSAAVRIWPLYTTAAGGQVTVTGFVAGRIASVTPPAPDTPLQFVIQPTVVSRHDAITDTDLRGPAATLNGNRYVLKIRRVD
ncbi:MAG: hypothetical protein K1X57_15530 [Gemmataceae bacterium]|nr:hypothetical protein [Gemmataceae bacterium]